MLSLRMMGSKRATEVVFGCRVLIHEGSCVPHFPLNPTVNPNLNKNWSLPAFFVATDSQSDSFI